MGIFGGSTALMMLVGVRDLSLAMFLLAAVAATTYFIAMVLAPLFPGTSWTDPEFKAETARPFDLAPE